MNLRRLLPVAALVLIPVALLATVIFGGRTYVPYDVATAAPAAWMYEPDEVAAAREGANLDVTEISIWFAPDLQAAREQLANGGWPGWNPWSHGGTVLQPHGLDGMLYPPVWLAIAAEDPLDVLHWLAWLHFAVAGLLTYGLLRKFGLGAWAATFGGLAFACSGTVCANAQFYMRLGSLVWLPGMLWACLALRDAAPGRALRPALGLATCMAMTWFAGFAPYSASATLVTAAFCLSLVVQTARNGNGIRAALPLTGWLLGGATMGLALAAIHILPVLAFFPESARSVAPDLSQVSHNVFPPGAALGYLMPEVFGHMTEQLALPYGKSPLAWLHCGRTEWGTDRVLPPAFNASEYAVYLGTATLFFVPFAFARGRRPWFAALGFVALFGLAAGLPVFRWAFHLPGIPTIPPMRFMGPATLCLVWIAAVGFERALSCRRAKVWLIAGGALLLFTVGRAAMSAPYLGSDGEHLASEMQWVERIAKDYERLTTRDDASPEEVVRDHFRKGGIDYMNRGAERWLDAERSLLIRLFAVAGMFLAGAVLLRSRRGRTAFAVCALAGTAFELIEHGRRANLGVHTLPTARTPVHEFLAADRADAAEQGGFAVARVGAPTDEPASPTFAPPSTLTPDRVRDWQIYTFVDALSNRPFIELWARRFARTQGARWNQLSAEQKAEARKVAGTYILAGTVPARLPATQAFLTAPYLDLIGIRWFLTPTRLPGGPAPTEIQVGRRKAFLYRNEGALPRAFTVAGLVGAPDEAAAAEALAAPKLDLRRAVVVGEGDAGTPTATNPRKVRFRVDEPSRVVLEVDAGTDPWLVLGDTALSGWAATVDGKAVPIERANLWMRRVALPETACTVEFRYTPPGLILGAWITGLVMLAGLGLLMWDWRRRARSRTNKTVVENPV